MIAQVYEKCDGDVELTIGHCYEWLARLKKERGGGSASAPVELEDEPVARRLDFAVFFPFFATTKWPFAVQVELSILVILIFYKGHSKTPGEMAQVSLNYLNSLYFCL